MIGEVIKKAVKAVATHKVKSSEINMAKKFLEKEGFVLPKDYKSQIKNMQIDPLGGSRLGQIKTELARMSKVVVGRNSRTGRAVKFTGDAAVSVLRAIQAENMRRQSVTRARSRKDAVLVPDVYNAGKLVPEGSQRAKKDMLSIFIPKYMTDAEAEAKVLKTTRNTTVDQELHERAEGYRNNWIKAYVNGAAGPEIENLLTNKLMSMSNRDIRQMAADITAGKVRNVRSIEDVYEGMGSGHIGAIIGLLDWFGYGFNELNDAQRREIALITDTPFTQNPDGSYDWHNVEYEFNKW